MYTTLQPQSPLAKNIFIPVFGTAPSSSFVRFRVPTLISHVYIYIYTTMFTQGHARAFNLSFANNNNNNTIIIYIYYYIAWHLTVRGDFPRSFCRGHVSVIRFKWKCRVFRANVPPPIRSHRRLFGDDARHYNIFE